MESEELQDLVYNYETKYPQGFTSKEIRKLMTVHFPNYTSEQLGEKIGVVTCQVIDGETVIYHIDLYHGIISLLESRNLRIEEWD